MERPVIFWNLVADLHVQRGLRGDLKFSLLLVKVQLMLLGGSACSLYTSATSLMCFFLVATYWVYRRLTVPFL